VPHERKADGATPEQILASIASFEEMPRARLRPARARWAPARSPFDPETGRESSNRDLGSGSGHGSGPGGEGHGAGGVVRRRFAFGGPSGAFRADVCFIPGRVSTLKEIRACEPAATFFTNELNVPPRAFNEGFPGITERTEWFRIEYRGKFKVKVADYYTFRLLSDDGAILYIDGHKIIDNDGQHLPQSKSTTVTLEPGEHDLRVTYYQGPRDNIALQLFVRQYEQGEKLFGPEI
jgi:hypothetical protein